MQERPFFIYTKEFFIRISYIVISYLLCLLIFFQYVNFIFLFEVYPFIKISYKKFISTQVTDLINTVWFLDFYLSSIFIFPLVGYHVSAFFSPSWYRYQLDLFKKFVLIIWFLFLPFFFFFHFKILPEILNFLSYWEIKESHSLLKIEIKARISLYINWILTTNFIFSYMVSTFGILILILNYLIKISKLYNFFKNKKNFLIFFSVFIIFIFLPPDIFSQFVTLFLIVIFYELIFIFLCIKLYQINFII
uniref:Preprotein translocase subunit SecY n=1 Tax=Renouxia sp. TaxID=2485823 RepID=A0A3G3MIE4_9FLOR|nr:preprotein translocase subunit SecY [Renouxia sp.]